MLDRGDAPQLVEVESFTIADINGVVMRCVSYEISAFGELCNRHVPCNPTDRRGEIGLDGLGGRIIRTRTSHDCMIHDPET